MLYHLHIALTLWLASTSVTPFFSSSFSPPCLLRFCFGFGSAALSMRNLCAFVLWFAFKQHTMPDIVNTSRVSTLAIGYEFACLFTEENVLFIPFQRASSQQRHRAMCVFRFAGIRFAHHLIFFSRVLTFHCVRLTNDFLILEPFYFCAYIFHFETLERWRRNKNKTWIIHRFQENPPDQMSYAQVSLWNGGSINELIFATCVKNDMCECERKKIISTFQRMPIIVVDTIAFDHRVWCDLMKCKSVSRCSSIIVEIKIGIFTFKFIPFIMVFVYALSPLKKYCISIWAVMRQFR